MTRRAGPPTARRVRNRSSCATGTTSAAITSRIPAPAPTAVRGSAGASRNFRGRSARAASRFASRKRPEALKAFSDACERNRAPILSILERVFADRRHVLEIGSGTGQHAAYFAPGLPHLKWQPSDRAENLPSIRLWASEAGAPNLAAPLELDVDSAWPSLV